MYESTLAKDVVYVTEPGIYEYKPAKFSGKFGWDRYYNLTEIYDWLDWLADHYPDIVQVITLPNKTFEGRKIKGVKVDFTPKQKKKSVVLESNIHGREWISSTTTTYILNQILLSSEGEGLNILAKRFVWYFFPVTNPDGFVYTHSKPNDKEVRHFAKTRKPTNVTGCIGVDPNRNFDFKWNPKNMTQNTTVECENSYPGPHAISEYCVVAWSKFLSTIGDNIHAYFSFHGYDNVLIIPYGHTKRQLDNSYEALEIAKLAAKALYQRYHTQYRVGSKADMLCSYENMDKDEELATACRYEEYLPFATGSTIDYVKGLFNPPLVFQYELRGNNRYVIPSSEIVPTAQETLDSIMTIFYEFDKLHPERGGVFVKSFPKEENKKIKLPEEHTQTIWYTKSKNIPLVVKNDQNMIQDLNTAAAKETRVANNSDKRDPNMVKSDILKKGRRSNKEATDKSYYQNWLLQQLLLRYTPNISFPNSLKPGYRSLYFHPHNFIDNDIDSEQVGPNYNIPVSHAFETYGQKRSFTNNLPGKTKLIPQESIKNILYSLISKEIKNNLIRPYGPMLHKSNVDILPNRKQFLSSNMPLYVIELQKQDEPNFKSNVAFDKEQILKENINRFRGHVENEYNSEPLENLNELLNIETLKFANDFTVKNGNINPMEFQNNANILSDTVKFLDTKDLSLEPIQTIKKTSERMPINLPSSLKVDNDHKPPEHSQQLPKLDRLVHENELSIENVTYGLSNVIDTKSDNTEVWTTNKPPVELPKLLKEVLEKAPLHLKNFSEINNEPLSKFTKPLANDMENDKFEKPVEKLQNDQILLYNETSPAEEDFLNGNGLFERFTNRPNYNMHEDAKQDSDQNNNKNGKATANRKDEDNDKFNFYLNNLKNENFILERDRLNPHKTSKRRFRKSVKRALDTLFLRPMKLILNRPHQFTLISDNANNLSDEAEFKNIYNMPLQHVKLTKTIQDNVGIEPINEAETGYKKLENYLQNNKDYLSQNNDPNTNLEIISKPLETDQLNFADAFEIDYDQRKYAKNVGHNKHDSDHNPTQDGNEDAYP